jgi:hypothetical protein
VIGLPECAKALHTSFPLDLAVEQIGSASLFGYHPCGMQRYDLSGD